MVSRWLSFMPTIWGIFDQRFERLDHGSVTWCSDRVVIDEDSEFRKHLGDVAEEDEQLNRRSRPSRKIRMDHRGGRRRAVDVGDDAHLLDRLARVHTDVTPTNSGTRFFTASTAAAAKVLYSSQLRL